MCRLYLLQTVCCNDLRFRCATKFAAFLWHDTALARSALHSTACVFSFQSHFFFLRKSAYTLSDLRPRKRTERCVRLCNAMSRSCSATLRGTACCNDFCIQCNWPQILLHGKNASLCSRRLTAHPNCTSKTQA
jgi:hypothetical protein